MTSRAGAEGQAGALPGLAAYWPLTGLRLRTSCRTGQLELRLPDAADLTALAGLAEAGVHDPAVQPFSVPWTDVEPAARRDARSGDDEVVIDGLERCLPMFGLAGR